MKRAQWLRGDLLGLLCARELAAGTVVTPVNSTTALEASGLFREVRRTRIGSPHVIAAMAACHAISGRGLRGQWRLPARQRGHASGTSRSRRWRRAMPCCRMLLVLAGGATPALPGVAAWLAGPAGAPQLQRPPAGDRPRRLPRRCSPRLSLATRPWNSCSARGRWPSTAPMGCAPRWPDGDILHVRPSGNAPELRCYAEAETPKRQSACAAPACRGLPLLLSGRPGS